MGFDFNKELQKLQGDIPEELLKPFEVSETGEKIIELSRKIENLSLQTEEIYELVENNSPDALLLKTLVGLCDLLEVYFAVADADGAGRRKLREILDGGGIDLLGAAGERLNPDIHRAVSSEKVEGVAAEQVLHIIQHGYSYRNKVIKKSKVVVSI